jgi:acyl carrier protein
MDHLVRILTDMTQDWETSGEPIGPQTKLIEDLGFESIDVVHLVVAIEEAVQRRDLRFEELLMSDGSYVEELTVDQIVDFLSKQLAA